MGVCGQFYLMDAQYPYALQQCLHIESNPCIHGAMMSVDIRSTVEACSHLATKNHKYYVVNFPVRVWKLARWVHIC